MREKIVAGYVRSLADVDGTDYFGRPKGDDEMSGEEFLAHVKRKGSGANPGDVPEEPER